MIIMIIIIVIRVDNAETRDAHTNWLTYIVYRNR